MFRKSSSAKQLPTPFPAGEADNEAPIAPEMPALKVLIVAHNHPRFFPGGTEIFAHHLFEELPKHTPCTTYFVGATGRISTVAHAGAGLQAISDKNGEPAANEWLLWGDPFDYFLQSQRTPEFLFRDFAGLLETLAPDVIHFHHTMRIGLEALKVARCVLPNVRIVYTLHDFVPICNRDGQMVRRTDESLCSEASPARCHQCFPERSAAVFKMREHWIKTHFDLVDRFLSPSRFLADRYIAWGIPAAKIAVMPNGHPEPEAIEPSSPPGKTRNRFGFFGQVSAYKGALVLLEAARLLIDDGFTDFRIDIHGNIGLQLEPFKEKFAAMLEGCKERVTFHGSYRRDELGKLMADIDWTVVPSIWWENAPLVIGEAFQYGRPVIASDIGGMAEHVRDGIDGLHFRVSDARALANTIRRACTEPGLWQRLAANVTPPLNLRDCAMRHAALYGELSLPPQGGG